MLNRGWVSVSKGRICFACCGGNCFEIVGAWILSVEISARSAVCFLFFRVIRKKQSALC